MDEEDSDEEEQEEQEDSDEEEQDEEEEDSDEEEQEEQEDSDEEEEEQEDSEEEDSEEEEISEEEDSEEEELDEDIVDDSLDAKMDAAFAFTMYSDLASLANELDIKKDELLEVSQEISDIEYALDISESCSSYIYCGDCTLNSGCVWCPDEDLCVEGDIDGPSEATCAAFEYGQCSTIECASFDTCSVCINYPECGWCDSFMECFEADAVDNNMCEDEDFFQIYDDTNNHCPSVEEEFEILYSTEDELVDDLTELQMRAIDLNYDIERLENDIDELEKLAEFYPLFLQVI